MIVKIFEENKEVVVKEISSLGELTDIVRPGQPAEVQIGDFVLKFPGFLINYNYFDSKNQKKMSLDTLEMLKLVSGFFFDRLKSLKQEEKEKVFKVTQEVMKSIFEKAPKDLIDLVYYSVSGVLTSQMVSAMIFALDEKSLLEVLKTGIEESKE